MSQQNAHVGTISCLEMTNFNGTPVLFSGGQEGKIKAWTFDQSSLKEMD